MRRYFSRQMAALLFIAATLIATGCSNGKEAKKSAQEFLDYFFATEYEMAQELCTDEVKEYLESSLKEFMALPQETKESVKRQVSSFKAVVESMEKLENKQIKIYYSVISAPDTLLSRRSLIMQEMEEGWRVSQICK